MSKYYTRYQPGHNNLNRAALEFGFLVRTNSGWIFGNEHQYQDSNGSDRDAMDYAIYEIDSTHPAAREVMSQVPLSDLQTLGNRIDAEVKERRRLAEERRAARRRENERRARAPMSVKLGDHARIRAQGK